VCVCVVGLTHTHIYACFVHAYTHTHIYIYTHTHTYTHTHSSNHELLAYSTDTKGDEIYTVYVKDIKANKVIDVIRDTDGSVCWANDNRTLFYVKMDAAHRPFKLFVHQVCVF